MQIPIISGIYSDSSPSVRVSYPVNMIPVVTASGVSNGFLRPGDGMVQGSTGPGTDRGGINWNDAHYRVMGSKLVSIDSSDVVTELGDVGTDGQAVSFDYSFDRLGVVSNGDLFYWDGTTLTEVTDADLGDPTDMIWIDGYFMCTDGEFIVTTELADPTSVSSTKYASAEVDPDPLQGLVKVRNEAHAIGRYTIEVFRNVGGTGFPFSRINGGHIERGAVGTHAITEFNDQMIFVGGGRNESISVYVGVNGRSQKVATREIDEILETYTEAQLATTVVEYRKDRSSDLIYIHLPDRTLVFDPSASQEVGEPVWCVLTSTTSGFSEYKAKHMVFVYNKWYFGDPTSTKFGYFSSDVSSHYGVKVRWEFGTQMIYNESRGASFDELELVGLTGNVDPADNPTISTSYSLDGQNWSQDRTISSGNENDTLQRLVWRRQGRMANRRMQRFRGDTASHITFQRLEARLRPLFA